MRVAALYDVHGNLPALEAALTEIDGLEVDFVLFGGDLAAGPLPRDTLERIMALGDRARCIRGNADRELVEALGRAAVVPPATRWAADQLTHAQIDFLARLPERIALDVDGLGGVLFCHGSPRSDDEIITRATPLERLRPMLEGVREGVVVCGHTHARFDRRALGRRLVNPGSVGMPYEGMPGAYWALLGPGVALRRTSYDVERAAEIVRASGYPEAEEFVSGNLLSCPTAEEATALFERMAARNAGGRRQGREGRPDPAGG
ncbi:MAG: metallophosphoesterase family protein [Thermomicrobiaceae bacterium]|nr:metallophosphoesterase family protein [Thermomicrobiaceae bacterium]